MVWGGGASAITHAGPPVLADGSYSAGNLVYDSADALWLCVTTGTPGAWVQVSNGGNAPLGQFLVTPSSYAPTSGRTQFSTTSATLAALAVAGTTVAAGSNGGTITNIAAWATPGAGQLAVASTAGYPNSGQITVATSNTPAIVAYTGLAGGNTFTGCTYVSGGTGTVATGGAVSLTGVSVNTGQFTAPASGNVLVTANPIATVTANTLFAFALAEHGTVTPVLGSAVVMEENSANAINPLPLKFLVTGLVAGSTHNFDLLFSTAGGTLTVNAQSITTTTPTSGATTGGPIIMEVQAA